MFSARTRGLFAASIVAAVVASLSCDDGGDALTGKKGGYTPPRPRGDAAVSDAELFAEKLFRALEEVLS